MNPFTTASKILIPCPLRMVSYLRKETEELNFPIIKETRMSVETQGTLSDCMKLNLYLRTGHRVLYMLKEFKATGPEDLYENIVKIPWEEYLDVNGYFSVISSVENEFILDTRFASLKCKDAIADRMNEKFGMRPDSGPERNKAVIYLYWKDRDAAVYLDSSGDTIAKHGYRKLPFKAPLQETLACAIILASKWDKKSNFVNPMCGSGTLAIEAAMIAVNKAPGLLRGNFGFMHFKGYDKEVWEKMRWEARQKTLRQPEGKIIATDISEDAIDAAVRNATTAGVNHLIEFQVCDFKDSPVPENGGVVALNPEYGERLGEEEELEGIYREIGDFFKKKCKGYTGYVFTGNSALGKKIGLKTKRKIEFFNGKIDCRLLEFELYEGSRRQKDVI
ncbi:MAG: class I SAM-dependent RNA methyltransferase [Cytophagaceae bacterium]|nr:class I SAM-dependent RNA methyltransferase [Cytophagaceae bacterium]